MSLPLAEPVPVAPFSGWLGARIEQLEAANESDPTGQALRMIGWDDETGARRLYRWRNTLVSGMVERAVVEDALHHAGVLWSDVYPADSVDARERWCPSCRQMVGVTADDLCLWCDSETLAERSRRRGGKPPGKYGRLTDIQLRALHRAYVEQGVSVNELAKRIYLKVGYRNANSASRCIFVGWKRLGLPCRERLEAVRLACTVHGLTPKHGPRVGYGVYRRRVLRGQEDQPQCKGIRRQHPRKGQRCQLRAMFGSEFCHSHDPATEPRRSAHLASMRSKRPASGPALPAAPFITWLHELRAERRSWDQVAELIGMHRSQVHRWKSGLTTGDKPLERIDIRRIRRSADAVGTTIEAIYAATEDELALLEIA